MPHHTITLALSLQSMSAGGCYTVSTCQDNKIWRKTRQSIVRLYGKERQESLKDLIHTSELNPSSNTKRWKLWTSLNRTDICISRAPVGAKNTIDKLFKLDFIEKVFLLFRLPITYWKKIRLLYSQLRPLLSSWFMAADDIWSADMAEK